MNGELAQAGTLVAYGNAWLSGDKRTRDRILDFENKSSTFQYVRSVAFQDDSGQSPSRTVGGWLESLDTGRFKRLSLIAGTASAHIPFINQGLWGIVASGHDMVEAWYGQWGVNRVDLQPTATNPRSWDVVYRGYRRPGTFQIESQSLAARALELRSSLEDAIAFARTDDTLVTWVTRFEQTLAAMAGSDQPTIEYHPDMLPEIGYSPAARRLLAIGVRAWCFGAMGSWNDIRFSDPLRQGNYDAVTARLFSAVVDAIREAVNAFGTAAG